MTKSKKAILLTDKEVLASTTSKISEHKKILSIYKNHTEVLDRVPCGSSYVDSCDFIKEASEYYQELHNRHAIFLDPETLTILMANPFSGIPTDFKVHANGNDAQAAVSELESIVQRKFDEE